MLHKRMRNQQTENITRELVDVFAASSLAAFLTLPGDRLPMPYALPCLAYLNFTLFIAQFNKSDILHTLSG